MSKPGLSKRWKIALIVIPVVVVLGIVVGAAAASAHFAGNPAACGDCHLMQPYVQSYFNSNYLDNVHSSGNTAVKCVDCHQQSVVQKAGELVAYIRGTSSVSLQDVNTQAACLSCHPIQQVIDAVKSNPEYADNPGLSYHLNAANAKACANPRAELVECQDCHKSHDAPVNYCANCHQSNFSVPYNN